MKLPQEVHSALEMIFKETSPVSVFVYGSQARGDSVTGSDFEVGILYEEKDKVGRSDLSKMHNIDGLNIYPFVHQDFISYKLDTPFPLAFYLKSLFDGGAETIFGEKVVESIESPKIMLSDLLEEISFQIAYALGALLSFRQKDTITAKEQLVKAILYGARVLLALNGVFVHTYDKIVTKTLELDLASEYKELLEYAMDLRAGKDEVKLEKIFTTISFLNQVVRNQVKERYTQGNTVVFDGADLK